MNLLTSGQVFAPASSGRLHCDGVPPVRAFTIAAGVRIESALTKPLGEQSEWLLPGNAAPETKGWIGERFDADAGLQYLNARYYDPELSLFLQPDWFEVTKAGVGTNRFSYSFNDPVNKFDPGGNEVEIDFDKDEGVVEVIDRDHYDPERETRYVSYDEYNFDYENVDYNQVLRIEGVFSGGRVDEGSVEDQGVGKNLPIPDGAYEVLEQKSRPDWYRLDAIGDGMPTNDHYDVEGVVNSEGETRSAFRLHTGSISHGCVTVCDMLDPDAKKGYEVMQRVMQQTSTVQRVDFSGFKALAGSVFGAGITRYGTMNVH